MDPLVAEPQSVFSYFAFLPIPSSQMLIMDCGNQTTASGTTRSTTSLAALDSWAPSSENPWDTERRAALEEEKGLGLPAEPKNGRGSCRLVDIQVQ